MKNNKIDNYILGDIIHCPEIFVKNFRNQVSNGTDVMDEALRMFNL